MLGTSSASAIPGVVSIGREKLPGTGLVSPPPQPRMAAVTTPAAAAAAATVLQCFKVGFSQAELDDLAAKTKLTLDRLRVYLTNENWLEHATVDQLKLVAKAIDGKGVRCVLANSWRKAQIVTAVSVLLFPPKETRATAPLPAATIRSPPGTASPAGVVAAAASAAAATASSSAAAAAAAHAAPDAHLVARLNGYMPAGHLLSFKSIPLYAQEVSAVQGHQAYQLYATITHAIRFTLPPRPAPDTRILLYLFNNNTVNGHQVFKPISQFVLNQHRVVIKSAGRLIPVSTDNNSFWANVTPQSWIAGNASFVTIDMPRHVIQRGYVMVSATTKTTEADLLTAMYARGFKSRSMDLPAGSEVAGLSAEKKLDAYRKALGEATKVRPTASGAGTGDDIEETEAIIKFSCPLSLQIPKHPAKSSKCPHIECFDASSFLQLNWNSKSALKCAVCNRNVDPNELEMDAFYCHLLETYGGKSDTCVVKPDGTHSIPGKAAAEAVDLDEPGSRSGNGSASEGGQRQPEVVAASSNGNGLKRKNTVVIDLDDIDDDVAPVAKKAKGPTIVIEIDD